jgi:opacity protein-like surface antigen
MKKNILITALFLISIAAWAQENSITIGGGYAFANIEESETNAIGEITTNDAGFYGGLGAGFMKSFNENMFMNLEYEWAYLSNGYYVDGFMNTVSLGIGVKF